MGKRLHDLKAQESYYKKIVDRYMKFCAASGSGQKLEEAFAALSISQQQQQPSTSLAKTSPAALDVVATTPDRTAATAAQNQELSLLLMAMRKLREAIVGSHRRDTFAARAYMFIIHASVLPRQWESYHPALLYLLQTIHPRTPLSPPELQEFVSYLILDLACRQNRLNDAFAVKHRYRNRDRRVEIVLKALAHDDWVRFWRMRGKVDGYQRVLMGWMEEAMRVHALKCVGRSYMMADKAYVERTADARWEDLVKSGVGWELESNGTVTIRRPKAK